MMLLPGCGCCGEKCTCRNCVRLSMFGAVGGGACNAFTGFLQADLSESYVIEGTSYECVYRFLLQWQDNSGSDNSAGNAYLVMPKVLPGTARLFVRTGLGWSADYETEQQECPRPGHNYTFTFTSADMVASTGNPDSCGVLSFRVEKCQPPPPPPGTQCCCDDYGSRLLYGDDECQGSSFAKPDPPLYTSLVFEWCGLVAEPTPNIGSGLAYYDDATIDQFVCTTTGRYATVDPSYTKATYKQLSVSYGGFGGGVPYDNECGFAANFTIGTYMSGEGYVTTDGDDYRFESPQTVELYGCYLSQCYDGSNLNVLMYLLDNTTDDTCGGTGHFTPCKFTQPQATALVAP